MTWDDWERWIHKQLRRTPWGTVLEVIPPWRESLEDFELQNQRFIDQKIQFYCEHRRWPKITESERCLLYYRIEYAAGVINILRNSEFASPGNEKVATTVQWLLITNWYSDGLDKWVQRLEWSRLACKMGIIQKPPMMPKNPEDGFAT
jgi:hypothetical protein